MDFQSLLCHLIMSLSDQAMFEDHAYDLLWRLIVIARDMVPLGWWGNTVKRITVLQRMWRNRLWRSHTVPDLIQLAHGMAKVYAEARQFGWIVPSLDYDRKLADRDYSTASKRQRTAERQRLYWAARHEMS